VNARAIVIAGSVLAAIAVIIVLLVSGGAETPNAFDDSVGDVSITNGPKPPEDTAVADIIEAEVARDGDDIVFRATMDAAIPKRVDDGSLSWRWDVYIDGTSAWIVSATVDVERSASITATQSNYGAGTYDDTLPGELSIEGDELTLTIRPGDIPDWPADFSWSLATSLDGDQGDPESALGTDVAPNEGRGRLKAES
jgi:hypothetical protein